MLYRFGQVIPEVMLYSFLCHSRRYMTLLCPISGDINIDRLVDLLICLTPPLAHESLLKVKEGLSLVHPGAWYLRM